MFAGMEWQSVEHCYQAMKFVGAHQLMMLQSMKPRKKERDEAFGERIWEMGQRRSELRPDWEAVKVEIMYNINAAKYWQHPDLQVDLLGTGDAEIVGVPSIAWISSSGKEEKWSTWNGVIQMRIREELRPPSERSVGFLESIMEKFRTYLTENGGMQLPLPTMREDSVPTDAGAGQGNHGAPDLDMSICICCLGQGTVEGLDDVCPLCEGLPL